MEESITTGIFTLCGILLGSILTWVINYLKEKRDRKDRYFFALLEKRFNINQEAFYNIERLKSVLHKDESIKIKTINEVQEWFNKNNLYLEPDIRKKFRNTILDVSLYNIKLQNYYNISIREGIESEEAKKKNKELNDTFDNIMVGLQDSIQTDINLYYKILK